MQQSGPPASRDSVPTPSPTSEGSALRRWPIGLLALGVSMCVAFVHAPVLQTQALTFDDEQYLTNNWLVQNPSAESVWRFFSEVLHPSTVQGYYQPLTMVSLMLDCAWGASPENLVPIRRTSLVLHALATGLVVAVLHQLFGRPWVAAGLGLLFGLHPFTVEPVAWSSERKTLLATTFALASLCAYLRFVRRGGWGAYGASVVFFLLALLSKPTSTPLPAALLLLDWWPLRRLSWRSVWEKAPHLALAAVFAVITYVSQARAGGVLPPTAGGPARVPLTIVHNLGYYARQLVWPSGLTPYNPEPENFGLAHPAVLFGLIAVPVVLAGLLVSLRWTRAAVTGAAIFVVLIFPTLGLIGFSIALVSAKYAYLPMIGVLIALAGGLARLSRRGRGFRWGGAAVVVGLALAAAVRVRAELVHWRTTEQLYRHMLVFNPDSGLLHSDLAASLATRAQAAEAAGDAERARQLLREAEDHLWTAVRGRSGGHTSRHNLGLLLYRSGRRAEAHQWFLEALRLNPNYVPSRVALAAWLLESGQTREAEEQLREAAARTAPDDPGFLEGLARLLVTQERFEEAVPYLERAVRLQPNAARLRNDLAGALGRLKRYEEAVPHLHQAVRLKPDLLEAQVNLGSILAELGRPAEAETPLRAAVRLKPDFAYAYRKLGEVLLAQGRRDEAVRVYEDGLRAAPGDADLRQALEAARAGVAP